MTAPLVANAAIISASSLLINNSARKLSTQAQQLPSAPLTQVQALVERVADAIGAADDEGLTNMTWSNHSRAALRAVAAWLRENPGPNSAWNAVARDLMDEANR